MLETSEFAPCTLLEHEGGTYSLLFNDFEATARAFEELGHDGGGYGWHGVVDALVRRKAPTLKKKVNFDPEASMFVAFGKDRDALRQVATLLREAVGDPELLKEAIRDANPKLMG